MCGYFISFFIICHELFLNVLNLGEVLATLDDDSVRKADNKLDPFPTNF